MKQLLILIVCTISFVYCRSQPINKPNPKAKLINDKAVQTFITYRQNADSVASVIRMLEQAISIDNNYFFAWNNKLSFECQLGRYDSALKTAIRIINIFPDELDIVFFIGVLEYKTGHNDEANEIFNKLIKMYDKVSDTNDDDDHLQTTIINKAIALKLLGRDAESKQILVSLSMKERDLAVRRHINTYISKSKEEIINAMIAARQ